MGKFTFRLEILLDIAIHQEEDAKKNLSLCLMELKDGQKQLLICSHKQTYALRSLVEDQKGKISIHKLISNHQYCQYLKEEVENMQRQVILLEEKVEKSREKLHEIMKRRKVLERLKENQHSSHLFEEQKSMQKELDEIATKLFYTSAGGL
ncbi:MAG: hypothetical protein VR72_01355 [Clostridiaceae bacterium BRH_c20a]|nr:MAG: hypothetical protein VR72_01355 [Clostridiaceae bacterium BRH_c20a]